MVQVIAHQVARDAAQRFLHAGDLRDDVRAIAIVFHHFLEAADLAFDATQAMAIGRLDFRVNSDRLAGVGVACTSGVRSMSPFAVRGHCYSRKSIVYPLPLYCNGRRCAQSCLAWMPPQASGAGAGCSGCYCAAQNTCGSKLPIAETGS